MCYGKRDDDQGGPLSRFKKPRSGTDVYTVHASSTEPSTSWMLPERKLIWKSNKQPTLRFCTSVVTVCLLSLRDRCFKVCAQFNVVFYILCNFYILITKFIYALKNHNLVIISKSFYLQYSTWYFSKNSILSYMCV